MTLYLKRSIVPVKIVVGRVYKGARTDHLETHVCGLQVKEDH